MKKLLLKILKTQNITITESFEFQRDKYATVSEIKKMKNLLMILQ